MASKRARLENQFLDLEAQVDYQEDSNDECDEDDLGDFLVSSEDELYDASAISSRLSAFGGRREKSNEEDSDDEEELAREIVEASRKRTRRQIANTAPSLASSGATPLITQQWMVPVMPGKEQLLVSNLQDFITNSRRENPTNYAHVKTHKYSGLKGRIYMDVSGPNELKTLLEGARFPGSIPRAKVVEDIGSAINDALYNLADTASGESHARVRKWVAGEWVRIRHRGAHRGDPALVAKQIDDSDTVQLLVVPRLPISTREDILPARAASPSSQVSSIGLGQKRKAPSQLSRPSADPRPQPISCQQEPLASTVSHEQSSSSGTSKRHYPHLPDPSHLTSLPLKKGLRILRKKKLYPNGLQLLEVFGTDFLEECSLLSKEELQTFMLAERYRQEVQNNIKDSGGANEVKKRLEELDAILPGAVLQACYGIAEGMWSEGDLFTVVGLSDYSGFVGNAVSVDQENKFLVLQSLEDSRIEVEIAFKNSSPFRRVGDWVKVAAGPNEGKEGVIVSVEGAGRGAEIVIQQAVGEVIEEFQVELRYLPGADTGSWVKVGAGPHKGKQGMVVRIEPDQKGSGLVTIRAAEEKLPQAECSSPSLPNLKQGSSALPPVIEPSTMSTSYPQNRTGSYSHGARWASSDPIQFSAKSGCLQALQPWTSSAKSLPNPSFSVILMPPQPSLGGPSQPSQSSGKMGGNPINPLEFIGQRVVVYKGEYKGRLGILKNAGGGSAGVEISGLTVGPVRTIKLDHLISEGNVHYNLAGTKIVTGGGNHSSLLQAFTISGITTEEYTGSFSHMRACTPPPQRAQTPCGPEFDDFQRHFLHEIAGRPLIFGDWYIFVKFSGGQASLENRKGHTTRRGRIFEESESGSQAHSDGPKVLITYKDKHTGAKLCHGSFKVDDLVPCPPGNGSTGKEVAILKGEHSWTIGTVEKYSRKKVTVGIRIFVGLDQEYQHKSIDFTAEEAAESLTLVSTNPSL